MSIRSLTEIAVERDTTSRSMRTRSTKRVHTRAAAADGDGRPPQTTADTLTSAIPTETLALYTGVVGIFAATAGADTPTGYIPFRWWAYAGFLVLTVVFVWLGYRFKATTAAGRRRAGSFPFLEAATALLAAATWGLVMPGSALSAQLDGTARTIAISTITLVGAALVGALSTLLTKGAKK